MHVEQPQEPIRVFGCSPSEAVEQAEAWGAQAKDAKGRKLRSDAPVLLAGVLSYPRQGEEWPEFKEKALVWLKSEYGDNLVSVIEHQDEQHPHIHFYAVPKPGQSFNNLHQGRAAAAEAKRKGETKAAQQYAHNNAMRDWQDRLYQAVGREFGLARLGPKRQRLTRAQWVAQQAAQQAILSAERAGVSTRKPTAEEQEAVFKDIEGKEVGLLRKERVYTEHELIKAANGGLRLGISMQMQMQGDAAAQAAREVAKRKMSVDAETRRTKAEAEALNAKLLAAEKKLEDYRTTLRERETALAILEAEHQEQTAEITKLTGYRDSLSQQLNIAEERLQELEPLRPQML
ncbi:plasmid recombination protein [Aeromonas salmonicida]|uniref:plasmid recombination protein n=1 Tax=Aeromonas salmonicida TaxID=645 RepID=UPI0034145AF9